MTHGETDLDDEWEQHGRFDPPAEAEDYFEYAASVARQEAERLRSERKDDEESEPPF